MILLAWTKDKAPPNTDPDQGEEPKVLSLNSTNGSLTLIQDPTSEIVIRDSNNAGSEKEGMTDYPDSGSLRMVVINESGGTENVIKLDQGTLSALFGTPLPTYRLTRILNNLNGIFNIIRSRKSADVRQLIEMAKVARNMDELSKVLSPEVYQGDERNPTKATF